MLHAIADRWGWKELLKVGLVLSRGVLGLFVSAVLGFGLYVMSLPVVLSIWGYGDSLAMLLVLATSIGAGIGSYITWFDRNYNFGVHGASARRGAGVCCGGRVAGVWGWSRVGSSDMEARHTRNEFYNDRCSYRRQYALANARLVQDNQGSAIVVAKTK